MIKFVKNVTIDGTLRMAGVIFLLTLPVVSAIIKASSNEE